MNKASILNRVFFSFIADSWRSDFANVKIFLPLICLLLLTCDAMSQTIVKLNLPKADEIERIEINRTSGIDWYKPDELLKLLPKFVASEGTYLSKQPFQRGTFVLKNGKHVDWLANYSDSILLYEGSTEQLFVLPKKDTPLFPIWDADGKTGFIDASGKIVLKTQNKTVGEFSENLAPVLIGDKWGYTNRAGEIVIQPRWKTLTQGYAAPVGAFSEGLAAVVEAVRWDVIDDSNYYAYKCGYINTKGEYVITPKFRQSCGSFSNGLAKIEVDSLGDEYETGKGWIGFLDKQGDWAIKPQFFEAGNFANGFTLVQSESLPQDLYTKIPETDLVRNNQNRKSLYLIDKTGRKATDLKDCGWRYSFSEGLALAHDENGQAEFINEQCEKVFSLAPEFQTDAIYTTAKDYGGAGRYADSSFFSEDLVLVYKIVAGKKVFGYLDRAGKTAIPFEFADATPFSDGLAGVVVREKDKEFNAYINPKGKIILRNTSGIVPFYNGLAFHLLKLWTISESAGKRNIYGYLNKQGKYVWLSPGAENYLDKNWIKANFSAAKDSR